MSEVNNTPSFTLPSFPAVTTSGLSHTSPSPSPSESNWSGLALFGQLSVASGIPSPSESARTSKVIVE